MARMKLTARHIRRAILVVFIVAANALVWSSLILVKPVIREPLGVITLLAFVMIPLGGYWLLFDCFRYERKPWPYILCAAIPYYFVWHYFECVRRRNAAERIPVRKLLNRVPDQNIDQVEQGTLASTVLWACLLVASTSFAVWVVLGDWLPKTTLELTLVFSFGAIQPWGALWMIYHALRYEKNPLRYVFLAFVPYAFAWYYFERVRRAVARKHIPQPNSR